MKVRTSDQNLSSKELFSLQLFIETGKGRLYRESDITDMLHKVGFSRVKITPLLGLLDVASAIKTK
ncbi:MAG: hypothetical protein JRN33_05155 [Nitrososphaerota archaeon]|jgi:hypothetical protein|nr:hypothetical protein [Nitrososphaerota archaeon]